MKAVAFIAGVAVLVAVPGGCSSEAPASVPTRRDGGPQEVRPDLVPAQLAGLNATTEDVTGLEKEAGKTSYLASTRLWALRSGERLRATLQISSFVADSEPGNERFQATVVAQIAESRWRPRVLGGVRVYVTAANQQPVFIWFRGTSLFVLSIAVDQPTPRSVLRQALELRT